MNAGLVENVSALEEILALQRENLPSRLSAQEVQEQGFVTVEHTLDILRQMHTALPSVVAWEGGRLVGYALSMARESRGLVPVLKSMFEVLDGLSVGGRPLASVPYYVMGQVCVAKAQRGKGVLEALYTAHRDAYASRFEQLVTEISVRNVRSLRAHARIGFSEINRYRDAFDSWVVVAWNWNSPP